MKKTPRHHTKKNTKKVRANARLRKKRHTRGGNAAFRKLVPFVEKHKDSLEWWNMSANPGAIHFLEQNPDEINWNMLSSNPEAVHLLEQNLDKIDWRALAINKWDPGFFKILGYFK